ncbi:hypothetical protein R5R35_006320 [Gryllus longicercus]
MESIVPIEEEFLKNPELKLQDMESLREWLAECRPNIPKIPDSLLILFLHSCYYNMEKTRKCITRFYELRANTPYHFNNRDVTRPELQTALSVLRFCIIPERDPNGYVIIFHKLKITEPSAYVFNDGVKLLQMTADCALHLHGTVPGMVMFFDASGVRLGHLTRVSLFAMRKFFQYIQEAKPVRLKAIHVANTSPIIDKILTVVRPFIQKELLDLVHFHTDNASLQKHLPTTCLPIDYGGVLEDIDTLHDKHAKFLEEMLPKFQQEEEYRKG